MENRLVIREKEGKRGVKGCVRGPCDRTISSLRWWTVYCIELNTHVNRTSKMGNLNKIGGLLQHQYPGCALILKFCKMSEETAKQGCTASLCGISYNCM